LAPNQPPSKWAALRDRLARSSRVFLLGVIVACGVEVLIDWNATLFEINILRERMRERGYNYVGILGKSSISPLRDEKADALATLTSGLFDDEDVVFVRFTKPDGQVVYENARTGYETKRGVAFREYYASQLARDVDGILHDPEGLRQRMAASRYRDFAQRWNDGVAALTAKFTTPKPPHASGTILYQDRLRTPEKERDSSVTYALGALREGDKPLGALVVAFSMDRTNAAIRTKYLKGLGMVVFFVGLILVQNIVSRRDKLRLLDLEARYGKAKEALRSAFGAPVTKGPLRFAAAVDQAPGAVDGMAWDGAKVDDGVELALIDPDGDGIDAAAVALHALRTIRERRDAARGSLLDDLRAIGEAVLSIPLTRPVGVLLARIDAEGRVEAIASPIGDLRGGKLERKPIAETPPGIVGPLHAISGELPSGALLVGAFGHGGDRGMKIDEVVAFVERAHVQGIDVAVTDAVTWARGRAKSLAERDLAVLAVAR